MFLVDNMNQNLRTGLDFLSVDFTLLWSTRTAKANNNNVHLRDIYFMVVCFSLPLLPRHQESICLCPIYSHIKAQMHIKQRQTGTRKHKYDSPSCMQVPPLFYTPTPTLVCQCSTDTIIILAHSACLWLSIHVRFKSCAWLFSLS